MTDIDEKTAAYVQQAHLGFEDLRQVTGQLAGLLLLVAVGDQSAAPDHPLLKSAVSLLQSASDRLKRACVTPSAQPHQQAMNQAMMAVDEAVDIARQQLERSAGHCDIDRMLISLRFAYARLQRVAERLPGFEMVSFDRGCCATTDHGRAIGPLARGIV